MKLSAWPLTDAKKFVPPTASVLSFLMITNSSVSCGAKAQCDGQQAAVGDIDGARHIGLIVAGASSRSVELHRVGGPCRQREGGCCSGARGGVKDGDDAGAGTRGQCAAGLDEDLRRGRRREGDDTTAAERSAGSNGVGGTTSVAPAHQQRSAVHGRCAQCRCWFRPG